MASKLSLRMKPVSFSIASRRSLSSLTTNTFRRSPKPIPAPTQSQRLPRQFLQSSFRRTYADNAGPPTPHVTLSPEPRPRKRFRFFRWAWRVTYLTTFFALGYTGYTIWEARNPADQLEPDPSKKTLVILGWYSFADYQVSLLTQF